MNIQHIFEQGVKLGLVVKSPSGQGIAATKLCTETIMKYQHYRDPYTACCLAVDYICNQYVDKIECARVELAVMIHELIKLTVKYQDVMRDNR